LAKRILIYTNHFYPEQFKINEIVDWLSEKNYEIRVITGLPNYPKGRIFKGYFFNNKKDKRYSKKIIINRLALIPRGSGTKIELVFNYLSYFMSCIFYTFYLMIFKKKYDIIFVHHTSPFLITIPPLLYSIVHRPYKILWDLDIWPETLKAVNVVSSKIIINLIENFVKKIYLYYDVVLAGSESFMQIIKTRYSGKIEYFPNWAEKVIESDPKEYKDKYHIPCDKFIIMYTGNIGEAQNFDSLIKTIKILDNKIHWVFVGDGRFKNKFKNICNTEKINDKVTFISQIHIDKIPSVVNYADALFLSLKNKKIFHKTVPAKLQTYMALGKPIIAVIKGEGADIIRKSNCGVVEENYNYSRLAISINNFVNKHKKDIEILGLNGREFYLKKFNSEIRKKQLYKLIDEKF